MVARPEIVATRALTSCSCVPTFSCFVSVPEARSESDAAEANDGAPSSPKLISDAVVAVSPVMGLA